MLKWFIRRRIAAFERASGYDASYTRDILEADLGAFLKFSKVAGLGRFREGVPLEAWYAAKITGTLAEDCGPCTQLAVASAERDGVPAPILKAILSGDERTMPETATLGARFARAVLSHDREADDLRSSIVQRWGRRGLVALSFAITAARLFPTLKYALGHGRACTQVRVGGVATPVLRKAA